jgi:hypothetical protein
MFANVPTRGARVTYDARMESEQSHEVFDTGLRKISHEIKSQLVLQGLFGTITGVLKGSSELPLGARVEIHAKGQVVGVEFDRRQIEGCSLRVAGAVLSSVIVLVEKLSAAIRSGSAETRSE